MQDHSHVGEAEGAQNIHLLVLHDAGFNEGAVVEVKGVNAEHNVRDVLLDVMEGIDLSAHADPVLSLPARDHDDAPAAPALRRLDHKIMV